MRYFSFVIIGILLLAYSSHLVGGETLNLNQNRPRLKYQQNNQVASGLIIIGNTTDDEFAMLSSKITVVNSEVKITGNPLVEEINPFLLNVSGIFKKEVNVHSNVIGTYFEVDDYHSEYNELERYKISDNRQYVESDDDFEANFDLIRPGYNFFRNNNSYRMIDDQRSGITAFVSRTGSITDITLNGTAGVSIGQIFSFRIITSIFYFTTTNHNFVGVLQTKDFGYGNIMPQSVMDYLKSNQFNLNLASGALGKKLFEDFRFTNIDWIDLGFNTTLNLNIFEAVYVITRETSSLLSTEIAIRSGLQLNQLDDDIETFQNDLINENLVDAFSDDLIAAFEDDLTQDVLDINGITVTSIILINDPTDSQNTTITNLSNLYDENIIFITQITALLIVTFVLLRWKKNS